MTLQHAALMSTESRFSEMILSRNFLITLQPFGLSKFCKKYGIAHTEGHFTHSKKRTRFFQNKRIYTDFRWIFHENKRIFAKGVRDFWE